VVNDVGAANANRVPSRRSLTSPTPHSCTTEALMDTTIAGFVKS